MKEEDIGAVVSHGESSLLKTDLNRGVVSLASAPNTYFHPHVCLNDEDGVRVIGEITPASNTAFYLWHNMIASSDDVWLNITLVIYLKDACSTNCARLSPRQSAYIISNLPAESRTAFLAKAKRWYLEKFLVEMKKGLDVITEQFENGDPLLNSDRRNRIFDIHGERLVGVDIAYTEPDIVGNRLYYSVCLGGTMLEYGEDGFLRADELINVRRKRQKDAVEAVRGTLRGLEQIERGMRP